MKTKVPASEWNKMVDFIFRHRLRSLLALGGDDWRHPWFTSPAWNADAQQWQVTVKPGFVNGTDVTVSVAGVSDPGTGLNESGHKDVPLTDSPLITLTTTRHITAGVPDFFAALGVRSETEVTEDQIEQGVLEIVSGLPTDPASERQLRACDLVLRCTRPRTTVDWSFGTQPELTLAQFQVGSASAGPSEFTLRATREFTSADFDDTDLLTGAVDDPGYDETKVCTIFFLSQPGAASDAELDETWTPYVRHDLFWNADYLVTAPVAGTPAQNLEVNLAGLGAAAGAQLTVNQLLQTNNDAFVAAMQFLTARAASGQITTPGARTNPNWNQATDLDPPFPFVGLPNVSDQATASARRG